MIVGIAFWAALSSRRPTTRFALTLAIIVSLAFYFDFSQPSVDRVGMFFVTSFLAAVAWVMPSRRLQFTAGFLAFSVSVVILWGLARRESTHWDSIALFGLPTLVISLCVGVTRILGFRVLKLTGQHSDREVELGTGRSIDQWVRLFTNERGLALSRVEIVDRARQDGAPFDWQRVIADAIDVVAGRTLVGIGDDGRPQTIEADAKVGLLDVFARRRGRLRWSILQIMILSLSVAILSALVKACRVPMPDVLIGLLLLAISLASVIIGLAVVCAWLNLHRSHWTDIRCGLTVVATAGIATAFCSLNVNFAPLRSFESYLIFFAQLWLAVFFSLGAVLIRHRGYRLVLVGRGQSPAIH
ncbi:MAG: hypothetical protein WBD20_16100 [Pirellulaceae bacterium]